MVAEAVIEQQRREFGGSPAGAPSVQVAAGAFSPYLAVGLVVNAVLTGNVTIAQPYGINNLPVGSLMYLVLTQDGTGSRTVAWASCYRDAPNWSSGGAAGTVASGEFRWDGNSWQYVGGSSAFAAPGISLFTVTGQANIILFPPVVKPNPAPTVGALTAAGVAPTIIRSTSTVIAPAAGGLTMTGVAVTMTLALALPVTGVLVITGLIPTRTSP